MLRLLLLYSTYIENRKPQEPFSKFLNAVVLQWYHGTWDTSEACMLGESIYNGMADALRHGMLWSLLIAPPHHQVPFGPPPIDPTHNAHPNTNVLTQ